MSSKASKGIGEKLLGLFIEEDVDSTAKPEVHDDERASAPPAAAPAAAKTVARAPVAPPVVTPGTPHDKNAFAAVYKRAGVPDADRERLTKVIGLVESLPSEASPEVKRAIVGASLEAFGVPIEGVVHTSNGAIAALDGYVVEGQRRTQEVRAEAEARIARLEAEIAEVRRLMGMQEDAQNELVRSTAIERARVRVALDFFDGARGAGQATPASPAVPRLRRIS